jgi:regulator of PEP synthase PpsR (kinase-PPPase family)
LPQRSHHIHLVSDATGETVSNVVRACLVQFEDVRVIHHRWWLLRGMGQVARVIEGIRRDPGMVVCTVVDPMMEEACRDLDVPCVPLLDPVMNALSRLFEAKGQSQPGRQHTLDEGYFNRIEAMHFALALDDGQSLDRLREAEVVVVGVSRTSKTPTSMFLANKGIRAANVPLVPGIDPPRQLLELSGPLVVGLTRDPKSLADIRRTRLRMMRQSDESDYADLEVVRNEVAEARRLYTRMGWVTIDVTRKSIEEVAATIMQKLGTSPWEGSF